MAATPGATVLSVGSVTISANGGNTGDLLKQIMAAAAGLTVVTVGAGATSLPAAPVSGGPFELVIDPGYTGTLNIPTGYALVVNGATADTNPITGGDSTTSIVGAGAVNYSGGAGVVLGLGTGGTVDDTATGAVMAFTGAYSVTASGGNDTVGFDGGNSTFTGSASGDVVDIGGGAPSAGSGAAAAAVAATSTVTDNVPVGISQTSNITSDAGLYEDSGLLTLNASGGSATVVTGSAAHVTLNASGGSQLVFDNIGGNVINAGPSTEYVTAVNVAASTYNASAGGADTIFASTAIDYSSAAGTANSLFFLGGAGAVTVSAAAAETVFGGAGGGSYSVGATSFIFIGGGGADTLTGGAGSSTVTAWGGVNENLTISQTGSAGETIGNTYITFGNNDSMNAAAGLGHSDWQIVNQALPNGVGSGNSTTPGTFTGDSTLVASNAGSDLFVVYIDPASATLPAAHTIDIANWQSSDTLFLSDLGNANQSLDATDASTVAAFEAGTSHSLTLSDGTTIDFTGAKPSTIAHV
jgi:hypothetical protein